MSKEKTSQLITPKKSLPWLLASLFTAMVLLFSQGLRPVLAWPKDPVDPDPIDSGKSTFTPLSNGFDWRVPSHFGADLNQDGLIDYNWEPENFAYKKSLIYPDGWPMYFYGCRTKEDNGTSVSTTNTYKWELNGDVFSSGACNLNYVKGFPALGKYHVRLTVTYGPGITSPTGANPEVFDQEVEVKDFLIISIGDSYASGEGNPDVPQQYETIYGYMHQTAPAKWEDERCDRSAIAGPAQAALDIEASDPKTSVTFLSFACAGATVETELYDPIMFSAGEPIVDMNPDITKPRGMGILGPYIGAQPNVPYSNVYAGYIPSQISQVQAALTPPAGKTARPLDALIISGGGNDLLFGNVVTACVTTVDCWNNATIMENPSWGPFNISKVVDYALHGGLGRMDDNIPHNYQDLAAQVNALDPKPAHVYLTQYPDQTHNDDGSYCRMLDDIFWPNPLLAITAPEARTAAIDALGGLNEAGKKLALDNASQGWQYVDGLASYEVDTNPATPPGTPGLFVRGHDGKGHGYCATDNWIRRADESELIQGPLYWRAGTQGTLHPNAEGHQAIKERLLYYMMPKLLPQQTPKPPVISGPVYAQDNLVDVQGLNGWYTQACQDGTCSPKAVMRVVGTADANIVGASVTINGMNACTVNGVSCHNGVSIDKKTYTWDLTVNNDGIYPFQFSLQDSTGATASGSAEIKADFRDPILNAQDPLTVNEGGSVVLSASASDPGGDPVNYDWDLDNDGSYETLDETPTFSAVDLDGPTSKTVGVQVIDRAGRTTTGQVEIDVANVAPAPTIDNILATNPEGTAINLSSSVNDPGKADTFTYDWSVTKDGTAFGSSGTDANYSFTPDDNGEYVVTLKVTDDDGGEGTDSQTINVTNVPPTVTITGPAVGSLYQVNTSVNITASVTDPSTSDTLSCSVNWDDGSSSDGTMTAGNCSASHIYTLAGVYSIQVTGTDDDNGSDMKPVMVVVYDPSAGFVTGGGSIDSPAGAYTADPTITGKATFGFVAKYQKGATVPSGNTQFKLHTASFDFNSDSYQWLVVSGAKAQFKGTGTVNDVSGYTFLLTATDGQLNGGGGVDKFRIKIWNADGVIYDNVLGTSDDIDSANPEAISGGNIMISSGR